MASTLRSRRLRRILAAYTVNRLGSWMGLVALSLAVFDHTHSGLAVAALVFAWQALPAFVVPAVVARVEASRQGRELSALYFFEAVVTAGLAVLAWHFSLPAILVLAALDGIAALSASSLLRAEIARVARAELPVPAHEAERSANAAVNFAFSVSFICGPVLGGIVAASAGVPAALLIDVGSFVVCGALLLDLHPHVEEAAGETIRARLRAAVTHIGTAPSLRALLVADTVALTLVQAAGPIEVVYAKATLRSGDAGYGLLITSWGAGVVLASLVFARARKQSLRRTLTAGVFALGCVFVGFAVAPSLAIACVAALIGGAGNGFEVPSMVSLVQRLTPAHLHGRLMGAVESLGALSLAVGLPLGGVLVAVSSPRVAFLVLGVGTLSTTAAFVRVSLPGERSGNARADAAEPLAR